MTITYSVPTINARLSAVVTAIDAGPSFGQFRCVDSTATTIAVITLQKPSGTVAGGVLTFNGLPLAATTTGGGQVVLADIEDSTGTLIASGLTVGPSTAFDIFMAAPFVNIGEAVSVTFASITGR